MELKNLKKTDVYERLKQSDISFNPEQKPGGVYEPVVVFGEGRSCYVSGHNCKTNGVLLHKGKVGEGVSFEEACEDARQCVVNILTSLHSALGDLNRVKKIVKVLVFVASNNDFTRQPAVADVASWTLIDVFGEEVGKAARSAVGVNVLPNDQSVEIEMLIDLHPTGD